MTSTYTNQNIQAGRAIESREDYQDSPTGSFDYWHDEIKGSAYMLRHWHRQADAISQRFIDERIGKSAVQRGHGVAPESSPVRSFRLNLFYSNVSTLTNLLYGNVPKVDVSRRFNDARDDVGRVSALMMERVLNNDICENEQEYDSVLRAVLEDRLVPGLGVARVRYDCQTRDEPVAPVVDASTGQTITPATTRKVITQEGAPADYFHWRDVLWSWTRTWADMRWIAFRTYLNKDEVRERFGPEAAENVEYKQQKLNVQTTNNDVPEQPEYTENWQRAEIWEIWDRTQRRVTWLNTGYNKLLDETDDPLQLRDFFPCPRFFIANATTSLFKPTPDFHLAQDLYNEIDKLQTRIAIITEAVKVVGVYDTSTPEISRMFKEGIENDLIPVDKWALFAEKGGLKGQIDWFPIEDVVSALLNLRQLRDETIQLLYQVTGLADILRGQLDHQYEGVGQTQLKQTFGSIRVQGLQESYATFASDLMRIKAEIIARHFDPQTIVQLANMPATFESPELIPQALQLIKSPEAKLRIKVKAESLAQMDYQRLQAERTEYLTALSTYLQAAGPLAKDAPDALPELLQLLQWGLSGYRGADEIEGVLDRAVEKAQQPKPDKPDPETSKIQAQIQLEQVKSQGSIQLEQVKAANTLKLRQADMFADVQTKQQEHRMKMAETAAEMQSELTQIQAKGQTDIQVEVIQSQVNADQHVAGVNAEINKDVVNHILEMDKLGKETAAHIGEMVVQAEVQQIPEDKSDAQEETGE